MLTWLHNRRELKKISKNLKNRFQNIVVVTGAGISKESGIDTFRDKNGIWKRYSIYEVARPEAMELTPEIFYNFHNKRAIELKDIKENASHTSLKDLELDYNTDIITQNVDDLHEKALSRNVLHIHGELYKVICNNCSSNIEYKDNIFGTNCINCNVGKYRPDIVLFKESVKDINLAYSILDEADLLIQIGTSGKVYPVADFPRHFEGIKINISLEEPDNIKYFDYNLKGRATKFVPLLVKILKNKQDLFFTK